MALAMAKNKKRRLNTQRPVAKQTTTKQKLQDKKRSPSKISQPTIPFEPEDRILLIGEGDFSFAKSIVEHHGCCDVTATCYESKHDLFEKYHPQGEQHVQYLEDEGQTVLYNVDATKLEATKVLKKGGLFDKILFNFPHVGGKSTDVNRQVRFNQELLVKFFASAMPLLVPSGTMVVTLFEGEPYTLWNIRDLARHSGLEVQTSFRFQPGAYPGYSHARTLGNIDGGGGWKGENRDSRSYVFKNKAVQASPKSNDGSGKRKRATDEDSDSEDG